LAWDVEEIARRLADSDYELGQEGRQTLQEFLDMTVDGVAATLQIMWQDDLKCWD